MLSEIFNVFFKCCLSSRVGSKKLNRRFHGRGRHLVGRAKNSDGLGRVIVSG